MDEFLAYNASVPSAVQQMQYEIRRESIIKEEVTRRKTIKSSRGLENAPIEKPPPSEEQLEMEHEAHSAFLESILPKKAPSLSEK